MSHLLNRSDFFSITLTVFCFICNKYFKENADEHSKTKEFLNVEPLNICKIYDLLKMMELLKRSFHISYIESAFHHSITSIFIHI